MRTRSAHIVCELIEPEGFGKIKRTVQDRQTKLRYNWILLFVGRTRRMTQYTHHKGCVCSIPLAVSCQTSTAENDYIISGTFRSNSSRVAIPDPQTEFASCFKSNVVSTKEKIPVPQNEDFGGNNWTRTSDPLHVKQVL